MEKEEKWLYEITPKNSLFSIDLKELWRYRDLLFLFVKRDVVTLYKQTILGPLWYIIQPLFTSIIFTIIFNNVAGIETPGMPSFLFNLAGVTSWNYFKECLIKNYLSLIPSLILPYQRRVDQKKILVSSLIFFLPLCSQLHGCHILQIVSNFYLNQ